MRRLANTVLAAALLAATGCQMMSGDQPQLAFTQMPPAVQSAFMQDYPNATIQKITCETRGGQYYYVITYQGDDTAGSAAKGTHTVTMNEGGDQVDKH
jgi:hypothetical protein